MTTSTRQGASGVEVTARVFGVAALVAYGLLKLSPRFFAVGDRPLDEGLTPLMPYLMFGPLVILTCLGACLALVVAVVCQRGSVRTATWLLALPGALLAAQGLVPALVRDPAPSEIAPVRIDSPMIPSPPVVPSLPAFPTASP